MVDLISQNAVPKDRVEKSKRTAYDEPSGIDGSEPIDDGLVSDLQKVASHRKRKKERKEDNKKVEIEQEREMKNLENFLFGSLYSPTEFGKDEDEEVRQEVDDSAAMFFVDRSANSALSVYEGDVDSAETSDEEDAKQKKPVWIDAEEERTRVNIAKVNRLRKLRKEEDESVISGSAYVS